MSDKRLVGLRQQLATADTLGAMKVAHDRACVLAKEAAAAQDFVFLDECTALRLDCTRKGGALLLAGAERVAGIDVEVWERRGAMDGAAFAAVVRRAQAMRRRHAGETSSPPRAERCREVAESPQARTVITEWCRDQSGNLTRFVAGVCARKFKQLVAAGGEPKKIEAQLIAAMLRSQEIQVEKKCR